MSEKPNNNTSPQNKSNTGSKRAGSPYSNKGYKPTTSQPTSSGVPTAPKGGSGKSD